MKKRYVTPRVKARELELEMKVLEGSMGVISTGNGEGTGDGDDLINKDYGFDDGDNPWRN